MCCFSKLAPVHSVSRQYQTWSQIGAPPYVLDWIKDGVTLPFDKTPERFVLPNRAFSDKEELFVDSELQRLLQEGSIVKCSEDDIPQCISPINCVPKKNNKFRLVTDLRELNQYCCKRNFQYEDIKSVLEVIRPADQLITVDVKDGFFHVPVHKEWQSFLGIQFKGSVYKWTCLPFGLSLSPYFFCKSDYFSSFTRIACCNLCG